MLSKGRVFEGKGPNGELTPAEFYGFVYKTINEAPWLKPPKTGALARIGRGTGNGSEITVAHHKSTGISWAFGLFGAHQAPKAMQLYIDNIVTGGRVMSIILAPPSPDGDLFVIDGSNPEPRHVLPRDTAMLNKTLGGVSLHAIV